jgi:hypothetical protein
MLSHNQQEASVTWEDQAMINEFGRVNNKLHELNAELTQKQVCHFSNVAE